MRILVAVVLVCGSATLAWGDTITLRPGADGTGGIQDVTMDDAWVETWSATTRGGNEYMYASYDARVALMGWADLFSIVPPTSSGETIVIDNATLENWTRHSYSGGVATSGEVFRMTTDWLLGAAGTNEFNVSGAHSDSANSTSWASGNLSSDDWTEVNKASFTAPSTEHTMYAIDITGIMQDIYDSGNNQGIAILPTADQGSSRLTISSSENVWANEKRPTLTLEYHYVPEPGSLALLGLGGLAILGRRRRMTS